MMTSGLMLERMIRLARGQHTANVPRTQIHPSRLDQQDILRSVEQVYGVSSEDVFSRKHVEAYHVAAWLLRRAANRSLNEVASLFRVSPSRISHIQRIIETTGFSARQHEVMKLCKIKQ